LRRGNPFRQPWRAQGLLSLPSIAPANSGRAGRVHALWPCKKEAFTGATAKSQKALFRKWRTPGRLFLDEKSGTCRAALQAKLLRVLEDGMVTRGRFFIGGDQSRMCAVICRPSNANLQETHSSRVLLGRTFYFRLCPFTRWTAFSVTASAREDVPLLASHFFLRLFAVGKGMGQWGKNAAFLAGGRPRCAQVLRFPRGMFSRNLKNIIGGAPLIEKW